MCLSLVLVVLVFLDEITEFLNFGPIDSHVNQKVIK